MNDYIEGLSKWKKKQVLIEQERKQEVERLNDEYDKELEYMMLKKYDDINDDEVYEKY